MKNIQALQQEIKNEILKTEAVREEDRQFRIKQMEKTTEYTVKMSQLLNIKEEKDIALKLVETAEKKLKDSKRVSQILDFIKSTLSQPHYI